jgi:hypothetical protein
MSTLTVGPYTKQSAARASGMRATFDVSPPTEGVVYHAERAHDLLRRQH